MIIDAFLYAGEADMLELRLRTLAGVVDHFVAVEANVTHQGEPRKTALWLEDERWAEWARGWRLHSHWSNDAPKIEGRGGNGTREFQRIERWHRDLLRPAAQHLADRYPPEDGEPIIVLTSDVDEIPDPLTLLKQVDMTWERLRLRPWWVMEQRFHSTGLDLLHPQQPWLGTCVSLLQDCRPQAQRDDRPCAHREGRNIPDGGWHFSWFGTDEERQRKLDTFSHAELRGTFDPAAARHNRVHANGEPLRHLNPFEMAKLSWPEPLTTGAFIPPDGWWS